MIVGIGCDITNINKFNNISDEFVNKVLTDKEKEIYIKKIGKRKAEFLAGRFSAKESIIKAFSNTLSLNMLDIEILYDCEKPVCSIDGFKVFISISHDSEYAISYALVSK